MMRLITVGFLIVLIGMVVIFAGIFSIVYQSWKTGCVEKPEEGVRGGGVVMIGPIPIIFGTDVGSLKIVMILAVVLMAIAVILFFLHFRMV
ncbi:MAG: TIGR00304 family membrane protein [Candidatus Methanospirareceae archaeon]